MDPGGLSVAKCDTRGVFSFLNKLFVCARIWSEKRETALAIGIPPLIWNAGQKTGVSSLRTPVPIAGRFLSSLYSYLAIHPSTLSQVRNSPTDATQLLLDSAMSCGLCPCN